LDILDPRIQAYRKTHGVKAEKILAVMNKNKQLINALSSPLGMILLKHLLEKSNYYLEKYVGMDVDRSDSKWHEAKAQYNAHVGLIDTYLEKINKYEIDLEKIQKGK
jgi:hypothetical protein